MGKGRESVPGARSPRRSLCPGLLVPDPLLCPCGLDVRSLVRQTKAHQ